MKRVLKHSFKVLKFSVKSIIRLMFFVVVLAAVLAAAAWFTAVKYINAHHLGNVVAGILQETFDRPVIIGGLKLESFKEVSLSNVKIADNTLGVYNDFISVGKLIIRFELMPLRENKLIINEILLKDVSVNIIKDAEGLYNIPPLNIKSTESAVGQTFNFTTDTRNLEVIIEDWTIDNGTFSYRDLAANISHSLNGIFIHFNNLKFNNDTDFNLSFVLRNKVREKIIETEVAAKGDVNLANFAPSKMSLNDTDIQVRSFREPLDFKVKVNNFIDPVINFSTTLPAFTYDDISIFLPTPYDFSIPSTKISTDLVISKGFKVFKISSFKASNKDITINADASLDFSSAPNMQKIRFSTGDFDIAKADYLSKLKAFALKGKLSAKGEFIFTDKKAALPNITLDLKGVDAFVSNFTITGVKGSLSISDNLDNWRATVSDGIFKVGRQTISKIKGNAAYEHKKQNFFALLNNSKFNDKDIKMQVSIAKVRQEAKRTIKMDLAMNKFEPMEVFYTVEDFVHALSHGQGGQKPEEGDLAWLHNFKKGIPYFMPNFSGTITAGEFYTPIISGHKFDAEFELKSLLPPMNKLDGKIDAQLENGVIYKLQEAADRQKALGIAFQPFVMMNNMERAGSFKMGKVLKDTPFEIMAASVDFNNGKMDINNFYADGSVIAADVEGNVDWIGEALDLDIVTMFKNTSKRGVLSENLTDESGEPALAFKTIGPMTKPAVQVRSPKKTGSKIKKAKEKGLRTNFSKGGKFAKGE